MSKEAMKLALEALEGIRRYGLDTLSGRVDGPDDREWQRACVNEMTKRARLGITAMREALAEQPAQQQELVLANGLTEAETNATASVMGLTKKAQQEPVAWRPDVCPITGLPFFMWIEHHETGQNVPTYGGPYDSYTIPVRDKDGSYCRERYDHDLGGWRSDEVEDVGIKIVSDQAYVSDDEPPASKPLTDERIFELASEHQDWDRNLIRVRSFARAIEAAHGIKE